MDKEHMLALRVMRLTKPSLLTTVPFSYDVDNLEKEEYSADSGFGTEQLLCLPQSFGNIFLGETFMSYISVHNDSVQQATEVTVKADLQTGSQRFSLTQPAIVDVLLPDHSIDDVMRHEVKELGTHILVCSVNYKNSSGVQSFFRKFFKFQVLKPLDVKTKFYNTEPNEVFLEAQIQNIMNSSMCIDKVNLEPSPMYNVSPLNEVEDGHSTYEGQLCLKPKDTRQYLYKLSIKPDCITKSLDKGATAIGKLDIVWKTSWGERGRLQTSQLQRPALGYSDIRVEIEEITPDIKIMKPFQIVCQITNCSERPKNLMVFFENQTNVVWKGILGYQLGKLNQKTSQLATFNLMATTPGLLGISGLRILDTDINRTYEFDYIHHVLIHGDE